MSIEIIPVIDLMGGIVVQGKGGKREEYAAIQSVITQHTDPMNVISDFLNLHAFNTIYIADLNAIMGGEANLELYIALTNDFPECTFWIDAGIKSYLQWQQLKNCGVEPVIGSETLIDLAWLECIDDAILSLDFKHNQFLGIEQLINTPSLWPNDVIVMNLDYIGAQAGPDINMLKKIKSIRPNINVVAAGGVRSNEDLALLQQEKVQKVLVASALHTGSLTIK